MAGEGSGSHGGDDGARSEQTAAETSKTVSGTSRARWHDGSTSRERRLGVRRALWAVLGKVEPGDTDALSVVASSSPRTRSACRRLQEVVLRLLKAFVGADEVARWW